MMTHSSMVQSFLRYDPSAEWKRRSSLPTDTEASPKKKKLKIAKDSDFCSPEFHNQSAPCIFEDIDVEDAIPAMTKDINRLSLPSACAFSPEQEPKKKREEAGGALENGDALEEDTKPQAMKKKRVSSHVSLEQEDPDSEESPKKKKKMEYSNDASLEQEHPIGIEESPKKKKRSSIYVSLEQERLIGIEESPKKKKKSSIHVSPEEEDSIGPEESTKKKKKSSIHVSLEEEDSIGPEESTKKKKKTKELLKDDSLKQEDPIGSEKSSKKKKKKKKKEKKKEKESSNYSSLDQEDPRDSKEASGEFRCLLEEVSAHFLPKDPSESGAFLFNFELSDEEESGDVEEAACSKPEWPVEPPKAERRSGGFLHFDPGQEEDFFSAKPDPEEMRTEWNRDRPRLCAVVYSAVRCAMWKAKEARQGKARASHAAKGKR